jgi:hypothetical protein
MDKRENINPKHLNILQLKDYTGWPEELSCHEKFPHPPQKKPSRQSLDTSNLDVERVIVTQESSEQLFSYYITSIIYFLMR